MRHPIPNLEHQFLGDDRTAAMATRFMDEEPSYETIRRYWTDPAYAAELDAETAEMRARAHAAIDAAIQRNRIQKELNDGWKA